MTSRDAPLRFLGQLVRTAAPGWRALGLTAFRGELSIDTDNSQYTFHNGVFVSRAKKPARFLDAPQTLLGLVLAGFLHEDDALDRWTCTAEWRRRSHAVLWRSDRIDPAAFVLTSPTSSFSRVDPEPSPWTKPPPSGILRMPRRIAQPPAIRRPAPPSMTRLHPARYAPSER